MYKRVKRQNFRKMGLVEHINVDTNSSEFVPSPGAAKRHQKLLQNEDIIKDIISQAVDEMPKINSQDVLQVCTNFMDQAGM